MTALTYCLDNAAVQARQSDVVAQSCSNYMANVVAVHCITRSELFDTSHFLDVMAEIIDQLSYRISSN